MAAIAKVAPDAKLCGPATTPDTGSWAAKYAADFGPSGKSRCHHTAYLPWRRQPQGHRRRASRQRMLSPAFVAQYQKLYDAFVPAVQKQGIAYRIEEPTAFYNGGAKD